MDEMQIIKTLTETEARSKSNTHRIDTLEKSHEAINNLASSVAVMAKEQEHMRGDIADTVDGIREVQASLSDMPTGAEHAELVSEIKSLKEKPGKRWEAVVEKIILVVVGAIIAWAMGKIGIS